MSATNRGGTRIVNDAYNTPSWCVRRLVEKATFLNNLPGMSRRVSRWLEPAAGPGQLIDALNGVLVGRPHWDACEINASHEAALGACAKNVVIGDFRDMPVVSGTYDIIISNPPYNLAMEFIKKSLEWEPKYVAMLLRLNFMGSDIRADFMQKHTPDLYIFPNRPQFVHGRTDNCEYTWALWDTSKEPGSPGKVVMLDATPLEERKLK